MLEALPTSNPCQNFTKTVASISKSIFKPIFREPWKILIADGGQFLINRLVPQKIGSKNSMIIPLHEPLFAFNCWDMSTEVSILTPTHEVLKENNA